MDQALPRVLIISHNVLSINGNMGRTLYSYFSAWPTDRLCQIYFHSEVPTTNLCKQYFRITDFDQIHSLQHFSREGSVLTEKDIQIEKMTSRVDQGRQTEIYQKGRARTPAIYWGRNALWSLGRWKSKGLDEWIRSCAPNVIFFASGDYVFAYRIALYISRTYHLPLTTCVFDDYYFSRPPESSLLARWNTYVFRETMRRTISTSVEQFYVHPAMKAQYDQAFGKCGELLYTVAEFHSTPEPDAAPLKISYLGGLGLKRYLSLVEIGQTLLRLIPDGSVLLDVYSSEKGSEILEQLNAKNGIRFCGQVSYDGVQKVIDESNILVLAESMDPVLLGRLRFSLSTKVPDYLGSNRCILAYGPKGAGSIDYLLDYSVACVAMAPTQLEAKMKSILFSAEVRRAYAEQQMRLALQNHTEEKNSETIKAAIFRAAGSYGE